MALPAFLETAVAKLEMNLRWLDFYQDGASRRGAANDQLKVVRRAEGMLGRYLGGTPGAHYEDIAPLIARLRAVTAQLVQMGGMRHLDHCAAVGVLSHYGACVLKGAIEKVVHHPLGPGWRGLEWRHIARIDRELALPSLIAGAPHRMLPEIIEAIEQRLQRHTSGRAPLPIEQADEAIQFLEHCSRALDAVREAAQQPPPRRARFRPKAKAPSPPAPTRGDGMTVREFTEWCDAVLGEIERATKAAREAMTPPGRGDGALAYGRGNDLTDRVSPGRRLDKIRAETQAAHRRFVDEPFIIRAEATSALSGGAAATPRIYGVSRAPVAGVRVPNLSLVSAHSPMGLLLRSLDPGHEGELTVENRSGLVKLARRVEVTPNGASHACRDAAVVCDAALQTRSARDWIERMRAATGDVSAPAPVPSAARGSDRRRSFELYDQRALYKAQREVLEADFQRPLLLMGPAGTGKTTALVKRIVDVLALALERDEGLEERRSALGIERALDDGCPIDRWVMVVPHSDWVRYARKAFREEGRLDIDTSLVRTWDNLRAEIHRRHFGADAAKPTGAEGLDDAAPSPLDLEAEVGALVEAIDGELREALTRAVSDLEGPGRDALPRSLRRVSLAGSIDKIYAAVSGVLAELAGFDLDGAGQDPDATTQDGPFVIASRAERSLRRAQGRWLDGVGAVRRALKARGHEPSERLAASLGLFVSLRNARVAYRAALARESETTLPEFVETRLGLMLGHVYVDEFENRTLLELATLACLTHPAAGAIAFSGDPEQATETGGTRADERVRRALELAACEPGAEIRFERRVRQSTRLAAASDALRQDRAGSVVVSPDDPGLVIVPRLPTVRWGDWAVERLAEILAAAGGEVTTAVITPSREARASLARFLGEKRTEIGLPVLELDEKSRPASAEPAVYVASLEEPHLLHGLEFEGALLMGVDEMLALPQGRNRVYVAMTRAARYLGVASAGALPEELAPLQGVAGGPAWG